MERREATSVVVLRKKASIVRQIASDLTFSYSEQDVPDEREAIRFKFYLFSSEVEKLTEALPKDIYAHHAIIGKL